MKVGILTFTDSYNYGALLQGYALMTAIQNMGANSQMIKFKRKRGANKKSEKINTQKISILKRIKLKSAKRKYALAKQRFDEFRENYLRFSQDYNDDEELLMKNPPNYDCYVCGSDQIWNPTHSGFSLAYMLAFVKNEGKRVAYAPSFGTKEDFSNIEIYGDMCRWLKKFDYLSCRESSGVSIISKMGRDDAVWVLDPVFLLSKPEWESILPTKRLIKEKYILLYALNEVSIKMMSKIKLFAKKQKLKIVVIPYSRTNIEIKKWGGVDKYFEGGPLEFLTLIRDAEYVFSNSFHGTAFSIIFNKKVFAFVGATKESEQKGERIKNILSRFDISDNFIDESVDILSKTIKFADERKLEELINHSKNYLKKAIFSND